MFGLAASRKELFYEGACQVHHKCSVLPSTWIQFSAYVGVENMNLPVDGLKDLSGNPLYIGPVMAQDTIYPTFLSPFIDESDAMMMEFKGNLFTTIQKIDL